MFCQTEHVGGEWTDRIEAQAIHIEKHRMILNENGTFKLRNLQNLQKTKKSLGVMPFDYQAKKSNSK